MGLFQEFISKLLKDNAFSLAKQEELIANSPPEKVYSIDSDHSPFFSAPEKLHSLLLEIANTYCSSTYVQPFIYTTYANIYNQKENIQSDTLFSHYYDNV
jgi:hypothetical protein